MVVAAALIAPSGAVEVVAGDGTVIATVALQNNGAGTHKMTMPGGTHQLTARYAGDATYGGNTSAVLAQTVERFRTTTTMGRSATSTNLGRRSSSAPRYSPTQTGTRHAWRRSRLLVGRRRCLHPGRCKTARPPARWACLRPRRDLIAAEYGGDATFDPSGANPAFPHGGQQRAFTSTYRVSPASILLGQVGWFHNGGRVPSTARLSGPVRAGLWQRDAARGTMA